MNRDELIARDFLTSLGRGAVEHEPDGNVTPDFLLDNRIAVEVRRLNQNYILPDGGREGFENIGKGAWLRMDRILQSLGPSINGECWTVIMQFRRPLNWKVLESDIISQLEAFKLTAVRQSIIFKFGDNFELDLMRTHRKLPNFFSLLGSSNVDAGGITMALIEKNLRLCVEEKETTVAKSRHKYDEWWLVLINRVDLNMEAEDYENFGLSLIPPLVHSFNKIILVDPRDSANWFEVCCPALSADVIATNPTHRGGDEMLQSALPGT